MTSLYRRDPDTGALTEIDPPGGEWTRLPVFPSGAGGLVGTADDWCRFGRMLLAGGEHEGRRVLHEETIAAMMTSHAEAEPGSPFLQGQGWVFGGSVDLAGPH